MVFAMAIVPADVEISMPPWAKDLPTLGAADGGDVDPGDTGTSVPAGG
jgi:hypothetical protein